MLPAATAAAAAAVIVVGAAVMVVLVSDAGCPRHGSGGAGASARTYDSEAESSSVDASCCVFDAKNTGLDLTQFAVCVCACVRPKQSSVITDSYLNGRFRARRAISHPAGRPVASHCNWLAIAALHAM